MQAVVMAGGEGSRLRPITIQRPKPMVPIANRPVMGHIIELLKQHKITDVIATLQYRADNIRDYFGDGSHLGTSINYSVETHPLGTAGSVKLAEKYLNRTEPFLIISGDALTDINLTNVIEFHKRVGAAVTLTLFHVPNPLEYGVIIVDGDGRIERFQEKPTWGEVMSDTVNTGIYVVSPEILDEIETGVPFDFSKDLFPLLMKKGVPLYGYIADGYWCDVGTIAEYARATSDFLNGKVKLGEIGRHIGGGIFIEDDVQIAGDAQLYGPIYLGEGTRIKGGVVIHGPSVFRAYTVVDNRSHIERSIVLRNTYIGEGVELRGAIIGRQCSLRSRAVVFESAVIADECTIGEGAVIHPNVKLWPNKQVEAGATVKSSVIWGSQARRTLFGRYGITGLVNVDITPEFAARLSAAFGATLPKGSRVIVNRDVNRGARMIKRAMVSGLPSAGISVEDVESVPIPVARYYTAVSGAAGGVHVRTSPYDQRVLDIRLFDQDGQNLSKQKERRIENIFFREDFRRVAFDELGLIDEASGVAEQRYIQDALKNVDVDAVRNTHFTLVVDYANAPTSLILPEILNQLGCTIIALNERVDGTKMAVSADAFQLGIEQLAGITLAMKADLGLRLDVGGERVWMVDGTGRKLSGTTTAAAFMELTLRTQPGNVAVMANQPLVFEQIAARHGTTVQRVKIDPQALMSAATQENIVLVMSGAGEFIAPSFHRLIDAMFPVAKLLEYLAIHKTTLAEVVNALPPYHVVAKRVPCPWEQKGTVMRLLNEQYKDRITEHVEGMRIQLAEREWALIVPEADEPVFYIFAEGSSDENATMLVDRYARVIEGLRG